MPGSGKSTIVSALKIKGFEALNLGDGVRAEAKRRNLEPTGDNLGKLMLELREKNGPGAIAALLTEPIKNSQSKIIIIDGVRSTAEIEVLKNVGSFDHSMTKWSFKEAKVLLTEYIIERKAEMMDAQNQDIVKTMYDPLGRAFNMRAFHIEQMDTILRSKMTPIDQDSETIPLTKHQTEENLAVMAEKSEQEENKEEISEENKENMLEKQPGIQRLIFHINGGVDPARTSTNANEGM